MSQTSRRPDRGQTPSTPRWVKVFGIIFIVLVLLFGILHLTGNSLGGHGDPLPPGGAGDTPSAEVGGMPAGDPGSRTWSIESGGRQP